MFNCIKFYYHKIKCWICFKLYIALTLVCQNALRISIAHWHVYNSQQELNFMIDFQVILFFVAQAIFHPSSPNGFPIRALSRAHQSALLRQI